MGSNDKDRRAPALARHEVQADPRMLREVLSQIEQDLDGLDGRIRRKVLLLVGALADHWLRQAPRKKHLMMLDIERSPSRLRIEASTNDGELPADFWRAVGPAVAAGLADSWGIDRRGGNGAWFEIAASWTDKGP